MRLKKGVDEGQNDTGVPCVQKIIFKLANFRCFFSESEP